MLARVAGAGLPQNAAVKVCDGLDQGTLFVNKLTRMRCIILELQTLTVTATRVQLLALDAVCLFSQVPVPWHPVELPCEHRNKRIRSSLVLSVQPSKSCGSGWLLKSFGSLVNIRTHSSHSACTARLGLLCVRLGLVQEKFVVAT